MDRFKYVQKVGDCDGVPWIVECAFGWCEEEDDQIRRLVTGVNWSPGILNPFRELGPAGTSLDTLLTSQRVSEEEPVVMVLHMTMPRVEYSDRGKSAVIIPE